MSIAGPKNTIYSNNLDIRNNVLEEGMKYYSHWLSVEEGSINESDIKLELLLNQVDYESNKLIIHDNLQNMDIEVIINNGSPVCTTCKTDDCSHVGFAIGVQFKIN